MSRYILYARKSTESEDRQVLSIESQIRELKEHARAQHLEIAAIFSESRSAKAPGRPVFGQMLADIAKGRADALLCWKLDRLARNPVDGGALIWALDQGKLKEIVTLEKTFLNRGDEKFWMQLEFGIAKKYVDDLSDNVKRGNRAKLAQGWLPGLPPIGYLNDLATKTIVADPERFPLVRRIWDLVLAGRSPSEVLTIANEEWGFRTRKARRSGNKPLARSALYTMLSNPFYYGLIVRLGEPYPGAHVSMVTRDEFDRVQDLLGRPNRKHKKKYLFAFTGLIRCGECGAMVTAEEKINRQGHHYIYYHCTKRLSTVSCSQRTIRHHALEEQLQDALHRVELDDQFRDWALTYLREIEADEIAGRKAAVLSVAEARRGTERQLESLLSLRLRELISDDEYAVRKQGLTAELLRLREREGTANGPSWFEPVERAILFANQAPKRFAIAPSAEKREIALALGSNFELCDRILRIQLQKPFALMADRPNNITWQGLVDGIRTFFEEHPTAISWPSFCRPREQGYSFMPAQGPQAG